MLDIRNTACLVKFTFLGTPAWDSAQTWTFVKKSEHTPASFYLIVHESIVFDTHDYIRLTFLQQLWQSAFG